MTGIPDDFPVRPLKEGEKAKDRVTCGTCRRSWDDAIPTQYTPAPSARCPFEAFHDEPEEDDDPRTTLLAELDSPDAARLLASGAVPFLAPGKLYRERYRDGDPQPERERARRRLESA